MDMKFAFRAISACLLMPLLLQSCAAVPPLTALAPTHSPTQVVASSTPQPPSPTVTSTPTQPAIPSATSTLVADPIRETPASLMLHRKNYKFDAVQFVSDFIRLLKQTDLQVTTYRDLANSPNLSLIKKGKLFIFTIDDIYLRYPIDASV
jgi:hypothetical protein